MKICSHLELPDEYVDRLDDPLHLRCMEIPCSWCGAQWNSDNPADPTCPSWTIEHHPLCEFVAYENNPNNPTTLALRAANRSNSN